MSIDLALKLALPEVEFGLQGLVLFGQLPYLTFRGGHLGGQGAGRHLDFFFHLGAGLGIEFGAGIELPNTGVFGQKFGLVGGFEALVIGGDFSIHLVDLGDSPHGL